MMHRKLVPIAAVVLTLAGLTRMASADVVFSTRGNGITQDDMDNFVIFASTDNILGATVEDGTFGGGSGPFTVDSLRLGYYNQSSTPVSVDALVKFYDNVNFSTSNTGAAATSQIGSTYHLNFTAVPGSNGVSFTTFGETPLLSLGSPLAFPDSTFAISVEFVNPNTTTHNNIVIPIFHNVPLNVGGSNDLFFADWDGDGVVSGTDWGNWYVPPDPNVQGDQGFPAANLFVELNGTVPEPASLSLLALGGLVGLRRRRA